MQIVAALVWPAFALVFAGIFAGLWRADRVRLHLLGFAAGFFALFLAMTALLAIPSFDPVLSIPPLHALASLSVVAIIWGAAKRLGQKIPLGAMLALIAGSCAALFISLRTSEHSVTLLVQNGTSGLLFAMGAVILWTARSADYLDRMLVGTISLLAAFSLFRPIVVLFLNIDLAPLIAQERELHAVNVVIMTLLTVMLGGVLIAIAIKEAIEIRHKAARIDPISGFLDQRTFEQSCVPALANSHRLDIPATLAVLEFDRFDMLQDKWGKDTIERVIREICDVVRSWQRESDIIGRIGEHRVGVLFVGVGAHSAQSIVQNLRMDIDRNLNDAMSSDLRFTLSASIAQNEAGDDVDAILRAALQPLGSMQHAGPGATFVNGVQTQLPPLRRPTDETFVTLG